MKEEFIFKCDWCNEMFTNNAPTMKHLCELNKPESRIAEPKDLLPPNDHIIELEAIRTRFCNETQNNYEGKH